MRTGSELRATDARAVKTKWAPRISAESAREELDMNSLSQSSGIRGQETKFCERCFVLFLRTIGVSTKYHPVRECPRCV